MVASGDTWVLKMDVSKYFFSIRHELAMAVVRDKISCPATLKLLDTIIASTGGTGETDPVGIPVGNLTSQWIANLVGNRIDQWAKRTMGLLLLIFHKSLSDPLSQNLSLNNKGNTNATI